MRTLNKSMPHLTRIVPKRLLVLALVFMILMVVPNTAF